MFFTHPSIARFVCKALGLGKNKRHIRILDPS